MKKTIIYFLGIAITTLLCCSCEDNSSGKYPYDTIRFIKTNTILLNTSVKVLETENISGWDNELYPMEIWVDNEDIAIINDQGILMANKEGSVTVYAKVQSVNGIIEDSKIYHISEKLYKLTNDECQYLIDAGCDLNTDYRISLSELESTTCLKSIIPDYLLLKLQPYLPNLKDAKLFTTLPSLDLSGFKLNSLLLDGTYYSAEEQEIYRAKNLKELKLCSSLESFEFTHFSEFIVLDLSYLTSLKKIKRVYRLDAVMEIIPPLSIEELNLDFCTITLKDIYNNLTKISLRDSPMRSITFDKETLPALKELWYKSTYNFPEKIDIHTFEASDLDYIDISWVDTLILSESIFNEYNRYSIFAPEKIIK